ncbi:hypothetical protein A3SI_16692 [Nitritalea halalkaliphila LW7]|uniref:DUF11 domain-containing protein n=1 Tax=Nitritalea halalkaliphila LW7 TaxID=1189621 RepID=I5BWT1_9BACT|nr:gliding motility-associated C-terminal domain-containing protein [Nitritalea halalkaliphila]EIM74033.1 hypothetical protein A3SI_16692 [Nitritalea halalkaliphila LW7]
MIDRLAPGEEVLFTITALVTAESGSIINTVRVEGDNVDPVEDSNDPVPVGGLDVAILKEVSAQVIRVGEQFEFLITVENISTVTANGLTVTDFISPLVTFRDAINSTGTASFNNATRVVTWQIETLAPGATATLRIIAEATRAGTVSNTARLRTEQRDINEENNTSRTEHIQIDLVIPNVFTPNGDGINDTWEIRGLDELFVSNKLIVVNRYGVEVFRASDYQGDWNGSNLNSGTYYYQLEVTDENGVSTKFTGFVTIIN